MVRAASDPNDRLRRLGLETRGEVNFSRFVAEHAPIEDALLAELIEQDGRMRIARGKPVTLERYIEAVPDLLDRPDPLDAAIDVALRSLSRSSHPDDKAIDQLIDRYPQLADSIEEAAALNNALWSTTGLRRRLSASNPRSLPEEFGPPISGSESRESRYVLQQLLGSGAYGQVYLAVDRQLSDDDHPAMVAVKILAADERNKPSRHALAEEATKARRIDHPNVVRVLDRGVSERGEEYIVYEYVDGGDLGQWLRQQHGLISIRLAVQLAAQIARGVQAAHVAGLVHCDLKPNNIMLKAERHAAKDGSPSSDRSSRPTQPSAGGEKEPSQAVGPSEPPPTDPILTNLTPKVADFGIAIRSGESLSLLQSDDDQRHPVGNLAYISPEQYRMENGSLTVPSDVYALGGVLFSLLTGELPNGRTVEEIAQTHHPEHGRTAPPRLRLLRREIDSDLEAICRRAMAIRPENRYSAAGAMADDLEAWLRNEPIYWTEPSMPRLARLWIKRRPAMAASLLVVVILLAAGLHYAVAAREAAALAREHEQQREIEQLRADQQQLRADQAAALNAYRERVAGTLHGQMKHMTETSAATTQVLSVLWAFHHLFGTMGFEVADDAASFEDMRLKTIEDKLKRLADEGRDETLEARLWQTNLVFWLTGRGEVERAEPLLRELQSAWSAVLDPHDPWLDLLDAIDASLTVRKHLARSAGDVGSAHASAEDDARHAALTEAERVLISYEREVAAYDFGNPAHTLVLDAMSDLYGPALLDQPGKYAAVVRRQEELAAYSPMGIR